MSLSLFAMKGPLPFSGLKPSIQSLPKVKKSVHSKAAFDGHKHHDGFADDVIFRYESPISGIHRIIAVVAHHEVIIHAECIGSGWFPINADLIC